MKKLLQWQQEVLMDDAQDIIVNKARRVGATELAYFISKRLGTTLYVCNTLRDKKRFRNAFDTKDAAKDFDAYAYTIANYDLYDIDVKELRGINFDKVIYDEITLPRAYEVQDKLNIKEDVQGYYLLRQSDDVSIYTIPTICNHFMDTKTLNEISKTLKKEHVKEELWANLTDDVINKITDSLY